MAARAEGRIDDGLPRLHGKEVSHLLRENRDVISRVCPRDVRQHRPHSLRSRPDESPLRPVPDLDVVVHAGEHDVLVDPGVLRELRRDDHASLLVELGDRRARENEPLHLPRLARERVELGDPRHVRVPALARIHLDVALDPARQHDSRLEVVAEPSRKREPVLVVDGVLVLAVEHGVNGASCPPTRPHFTPLFPTSQPLW